MSQQIIDISTPDDGLGDVLRTGFDKTNQNFTELYNGKVDKETGKGLSENDFTDADKTKLDGIEAGAQVNVQADFSETDPTSDSFILNKPPSLYASVGHFHYNDLATHTTHLVVLPSVPKKLTNDTLGVGTEKDFAPYGVADVWETTDNAFTFSPLDLGDQAQIRFDFLLSSTSPSQKFTLYVKFGVGSPSEYDMLVSSWVEKDVITYGQIIRELSFSIDNEDWLFNPAEIYILSDDDASVKVNGWYVPIIRKSINVINIEGDFLSSIISTYTPATTPLASTELALVYQDGEWKKVAVSEFGGGTTSESELHKYWFSYIASHVTSAVLYTNVANGNLTTTGTQSLITTIGTNLYNSFHFLNWVGATTAGANAGIKNNNTADAYYRQGVKAYFIFSNNDTNTAHSTAVGMYGLATAIPNVAISSFTTDFVGVGNDTGDTNLSLYCKRNDVTASYIKIDCGSNFPAHTAGTDVFMLEFESNNTSVQADLVITLTLTNLITGDIFTHTFTGLECPDLNKAMLTTINRNNRGSGATPVIRWVKTFVERKLF